MSRALKSGRDVLNSAQRSYCMSRIRGRETAPELLLALWCREIGLEPELESHLPGKPDMVFPAQRVAVFVDGCFWHGCSVHYVAPRARASFWMAKLFANQFRDLLFAEELESTGWTVLRYWEHELRNPLAAATVALAVDEQVRRLVQAGALRQ